MARLAFSLRKRQSSPEKATSVALRRHPAFFSTVWDLSVSFALNPLAAGFPLEVHGIGGDCFPLDIQIGGHLLENGDLAGFLINGLLRQHHAVFCHICAENLQQAVGVPLILLYREWTFHPRRSLSPQCRTAYGEYPKQHRLFPCH
jgi:hypothetical protein